MALKIYFCDGCNESIPLKDINENKITIDAGKIFCARCAPKKAVKDPSRASPIFLGVLVALVGIGFGLIAFITSQQIRDVGTEMREARRDLGIMQSEFAALRRDAMPRDDAERTKTTVNDAIVAMQRELAGQSDRLKVYEGLVRTEVTAVETKLQGSFSAALMGQAKELGKIADEWHALATTLQAQKDRVPELEAAIAQIRTDVEAVRAMRVAAGPGTDSGPSDQGLPDDSSKDVLSRLKDADPGRRFAAVVELARFRTPAVVTALEAMLQDPESYVRDGSIRSLKKINAPASIPAIIKALRDDDFYVRSSAREALRAMTKMDIAFDPGADAGDRESKVREWEGWWELNQSRLLKGK